MRHRLSFALSTVAVLALAGCSTMNWSHTPQYVARSTGGPNCIRTAMPGDTSIRIYCPKYISEKTLARQAPPAEGDTSCRTLSESPDGKVERVCRSAAQWEAYDGAAVLTGVTCRWSRASRKAPSQEICRDEAQWRAARVVPRPPASVGSNWPAHSQPSSSQGPSSSYGYFPAGTAIGAQ